MTSQSDFDLIDFSDHLIQESPQEPIEQGFRYPKTSHNFKINRQSNEEAICGPKEDNHAMDTSEDKSLIREDIVYDRDGYPVYPDPLEVVMKNYPNLCLMPRLRPPKTPNPVDIPSTPLLYASGYRLRRPKPLEPLVDDLLLK